MAYTTYKVLTFLLSALLVGGVLSWMIYETARLNYLESRIEALESD